MELSVTTPGLLFPAIAILTLGFVNRYLGIAGVIRDFKTDYDNGRVRTEITKQLTILRRRVELARAMIGVAIGALMLACASMFFLFVNWNEAGVILFGASVLAMIVSMAISLYETTLSNRSLMIELHHVLDQEANKDPR